MIELPTHIPQGLERGRIRNLLALTDLDFEIEPIAHRLSQINRYCGALRHPYSVATHSVVVSRLAPVSCAWDALLHDITESFGIGDMISPIKRKDAFYNALEHAIRCQLVEPFGLFPEESSAVRHADERAYQLECFYLRGDWPLPEHTRFEPWEPTPKEEVIARDLILHELTWRQGRDAFLDRYNFLRGLQ